MNANAYVTVKKLKACDNPAFPTPKFEDYRPGEDNGPVSLPVEYTITGKLLYDVQPGGLIFVARDSRNGVPIDGNFCSSPVVKIEGNQVFTRNSVYQVTQI